MHQRFIFRLPVYLLIQNLDACGDVATLPEQAGVGLHPTLPPPNPTLLPTVNIAPAKGWPAGITPRAAAGLAVNAFATGLDHPRWLYVLPNGDLLVAETNAPPQPEDSKGLKGWFMKRIIKRAGAGAYRAQIASLCCATKRRRHRRNANGFPAGAKLSLWHDARGQRLLCCQCR